MAHLRARSQSLKPADSTPAPEEETPSQDDKLYCVCKTPYDEDKVMIACDRCDEWYHPGCVGMPELEVDLVDQFMCENCRKSKSVPLICEKIANISFLAEDPSLKTTYKTRCRRGTHHVASHDERLPCWKPARGAFSKYCSDACGIEHTRAKIAASGQPAKKIWPAVEGARKREGVTIEHPRPSKKPKQANQDRIVKVEDSDNMDVDSEPREAVTKPKTLAAARLAQQAADQREVASLQQRLASVIRSREELKTALDRTQTRQRLLDLAVDRAVSNEEYCLWDHRLELGDAEWAEWMDTPAGVEAIRGNGKEDVDSDVLCHGEKDCSRHGDWQRMKDVEVGSEIQSKVCFFSQDLNKISEHFVFFDRWPLLGNFQKRKPT